MTTREEEIDLPSIENIIEDFNNLSPNEKKCFIDYVKAVLEDSRLCTSYGIEFNHNGRVNDYQGVIISQYLVFNKNVFYSPATVQGIINQMQKKQKPD
ncbi:hypothetical protein J4214_00185 [Candidatus Woesearchaeota archaeon]|nr:hypothetical protein [Candidatus Woesearchaeota archaeon]